MKKQAGTTHFFYQNGKLTTVSENGRPRTIFRADDRPLAEQHAGDAGNAGLLATDDKGSVLNVQSDDEDEDHCYSPYGYALNKNSGLATLDFNGEYKDTTLQAYLLGSGYRIFSPALMRFYSPDDLSPFGQGNFNSYCYCGSEPINSKDPSGHVKQPSSPSPSSPSKTLIMKIGEPDLLNMIAEPGVREKIFNYLPGKDLGKLASTSKKLHAEIGELSTKNAKKLDALKIHDASRGELKGILPIDIKDTRQKHKSVIEEISNLPIKRLEEIESDQPSHPGADFVRMRRNAIRLARHVRETGIPLEDPATGRRRGIRFDN